MCSRSNCIGFQGSCGREEHINCAAVILARGGSKGLPGKNVIDFCGKPLLAWTIEHCLKAKGVGSVWLSSDSDEILKVAQQVGANPIKRPAELAEDRSSAESGWLHALEYIEKREMVVDVVLAPQVTSPLREPSDIERGLKVFESEGYDSLFSCSVVEDLYFWERLGDGSLVSVNYDYKNRQRRQDIPRQYVENGSFYLFRPGVLRQHNNRLGGRIGCVEMEFWKMFEIDNASDLRICSAIMKEFILGCKI